MDGYDPPTVIGPVLTPAVPIEVTTGVLINVVWCAMKDLVFAPENMIPVPAPSPKSTAAGEDDTTMDAAVVDKGGGTIDDEGWINGR